jgi:hypothetical protein
LKALNVDSEDSFKNFHAVDVANTQVVFDGKEKIAGAQWQQLVVHARDSHGNPILDYAISVVTQDANGKVSELEDFEEDVHPFAADPSYRCFHVNLNNLKEKIAGKKLLVRIVASTGTDLVRYQGYNCSDIPVAPVSDDARKINYVDLDISKYEGDRPDAPSLFCPFTTTLVEIILNREPIARDDATLEIFGFLGFE